MLLPFRARDFRVSHRCLFLPRGSLAGPSSAREATFKLGFDFSTDSLIFQSTRSSRTTYFPRILSVTRVALRAFVVVEF